MLTSFREVQSPVATRTLPETRLTTFTLRDDEIREIADAVYRDDNPLRFESVRQSVLMFERLGYMVTRSPVPIPVCAPVRVVVGNLIVDRSLRIVTYRGREISLKLREFELLDVLARRPSRVFTRRMLLELAWPDAFDGDERTVDVHVLRIRRKLDDSGLIQAVAGVGYKLVPPATFSTASVA